uniref:Protein xylosyltransferase n=1 Tax=Calcidiscus leptoporus TaxID=127549 RepID=A0A7S0JC96_9EUKA|mmetsp:Transcript_48374/g.112030  ORF Transcript_48374/g.112030 Transcript_48374/m.112030 type:complete len:344 (+) Transcript_48374:188-1219(+)
MRCIALLFLTRGPMPHAALWSRFLSESSLCFRLAVHTPPGFQYALTDELEPFRRAQLPEEQREAKTERWSLGLARAAIRLLEVVLRDTSVEKMVLLSENDVPLYDAPTIHSLLLRMPRSLISSHDPAAGLNQATESLGHAHKPPLHKGPQWWALSRAHALIVVQKTRDPVWVDHLKQRLGVKCCSPLPPDECWVQTALFDALGESQLYEQITLFPSTMSFFLSTLPSCLTRSTSQGGAGQAGRAVELTMVPNTSNSWVVPSCAALLDLLSHMSSNFIVQPASHSSCRIRHMQIKWYCALFFRKMSGTLSSCVSTALHGDWGARLAKPGNANLSMYHHVCGTGG